MQLLTPSIGLIFWTFIVFISVYMALKKLAWPFILGAIKERENNLAEAMETARMLKEQIAISKKEHEQFMDEAYRSKELMIREAKEAATQIVIKAREEARVKCEAVVDDALTAIQKQKNDALAEALLQVEDIALEASEKLLRRELNKEVAISELSKG